MTPIQLIRPYLSFEDVEKDFKDIFASGMFTKGAHVQAFQQEFSAYVGAKHCFFATSATTALWVCLKMLEVGPGDEVIVSDFSFPASSNVVEDLGARVVFADVDPDTYNMLPEQLEQKITRRTKAVIFVDALGNPSGLTRIQEICRQHDIPLIEDAACAIGSAEHGRRCGGIADVTCFSFHPRKLLCTGEGGAITTDNDEWAEWLRVKLNHGADGMLGTALDFPEFGYNFRLPELQAAMGRRQLPALDSIIKERQAAKDFYADALAPLGFVPQAVREGAHHNVQSLVFRVPAHISRDDLHYHLKDQQIETSVGTYALSAVSFNRKKYNDVQPNALSLFETSITLPCYRDCDLQRVADAVIRYAQKAAA